MLLGFKKRFIDPIKIGTKVFTMRKRRKKEVKIGETLYMYTALRTKHCQLITNKEKLISKQKAWIRIIYITDTFLSLKICVDGRSLHRNEISEFVKFDGFTDENDFCKYWIDSVKKDRNKKGLRGQTCKIVESLTMYHWTDLRY
ncbi:MAG TPA: ASCH domain-containing protein [Bacteroidia bacterium]|nr:ASCH domain-containing protein [Bacteroidia bacterium]